MTQTDPITSQAGQDDSPFPEPAASASMEQSGFRRPNKCSFYRHAVVVRATHWINLLLITVLLMSGLQIFNAHPALYWGSDSDFQRPLLAMNDSEAEGGRRIGVTEIFGREFETTGLFGLSADSEGNMDDRGFPSWATIPSYGSLAKGRSWHFFFAWLFVINGMVYVSYAVFGRHLWRDLLPVWPEIKHMGRTIRDHVLLRFPKGEEAKRYNVLQQLSYLFIVFALGPLVILTGLTMSFWLDSVFPWLLDIFGGRQSARTIHFVCAFAFVAFVLLHVLMVLLAGSWNHVRSMVTGRYTIVEDQINHDGS